MNFSAFPLPSEIEGNNPIPGYVFSQLAKQLEISQYLETPECKRGIYPFSDLYGNWNNGKFTLFMSFRITQKLQIQL